ncbi:MAG: BatA domain-containing protein [Pirellulaceae bacterium]|nr:BatA domain-containing protein [Pirellulaceae bacterium]
MGLIQAGFLLALLALAIPVLVHLLSRWQVQRLELGTMQFLQEVIHDSAHRRWIRRWLLLATRMLLLAVLALLFARPFLPERRTGEGGRVRIVLIDRSASMTMPGKSGRLIDDAIAQATEVIDRTGQDVEVQWAWFDRNVEALPEGTTRPRPPRTTAGDTNYFAALKWARDRLAAREYSDAEVILATDLQQSGLAAEIADANAIDFPRDVPVRIIDVGRTAANNVAIVSLNTGTTQIPPSRPVVVSATVFNYGSMAAEELPITATASNGERSVRLKKTLNIPNDQAQEVAFDFGKLEPTRWQITVDIDVDDDLANDNRRIVAVDVASPMKTLVIDPGSKDDGARSVSYFLTAALQQGVATEIVNEQATENGLSAGLAGKKDDEPTSVQRRFSAEVLFLEDESSVSLADRKESLVVVAEAGAVPQRMIDELARYTRAGGRVLVFAGSRLSGAVADQWSNCQLAPGKLLRTENSTAMPFRIVQIASSGSMLEPFRDPQNGDLTRLAFRSMQKTKVNPNTHVLAWFDQEQPAITEHSLGSGRVAWFLSNADGEVSNWTTSPLYLPLIQQMASDLLELSGEGRIRLRSVGDVITPSDSRSMLGRDVPTGNEKGSADEVNLLYFEQPGFQNAGESVYVVNSPAKESETAKITEESFIKQFGITPASEDGDQDLRPVETAKKNELWPWLAAALVVLMVLEFSLSNRTPA